jgi:signal transduction histidine kinase
VSTSEHPTALVVNDDPVQLNLTSAILQKDGLQVFSCRSVEEALPYLTPRNRINVIVTDLHMPGIDGWQFCQLVRSPEYPALNQVPILVISATFSGVDAAQMTADLGANAFLAAPYKASVLQTTVRKLLQGDKPPVTLQVLIVEDSLTQATQLCCAFERRGYIVHCVSTGAMALELFRQHAPEIVILDYYLPDMTGDQLLPDVKHPGSQAIAVIITSDTSPENATHCILHGADSYVRKPFDPVYLIDLCEKARRQHALLRIKELLEARTKELERERADFLAMLTHDIKNPLGVILGCTEILMEEAKDRASTEELHFLQRLQSNALLVHSLVSNYLDYARSESGNLTLNKQPLDLGALLLRVVQRYEAEAHRREITLNFNLTQELSPFEGDPLALERVFTNLLHNALKFTPQSGCVTLSAERSNSEVAVSVTDTGCGIALEELPQIFQRYRRTVANRHQEGTGLGLFIVKALVEAHGGRVEVASMLGQGSCFTVFLPAPTAQQQQPDLGMGAI